MQDVCVAQMMIPKFFFPDGSLVWELHRGAYLCIHMIHLCCDSRCWKGNEPALCHIRQCLKDIQGQSNHTFRYRAQTQLTVAT